MEEGMVEGRTIHLVRTPRIPRKHLTWRLAEGLVEAKEEEDSIEELSGLEEEGV